MPAPDESRPTFPEKVARHLEAGELGRAREVLASRLAQSGFDRDLLEQLGWVLLKMGDHAEAGRYLFLSGCQRSDYRPSIDVFLGRCRRSNLRQFVSQWSSVLRRTPVQDLPAPVLAELSARGMPLDCKGTACLEDLRHGRVTRSRSRTRLFVLVLAVLATYIVLRSVW